MRFVLSELFRSPRTATFRVRASDVNVVLRTRTSDAWVLGEIFRELAYEPPTQVCDVLRSTGTSLRVLDLGGNIGLFGAFVLMRFPGATVTSVEPDPDNAQILDRCITANAAVGRWELIQACAGIGPGYASLAAHGNAHTRVEYESAAQGTIRVPVVDTFPLAEHADFLKMDIEGGEWPILADRRLSDMSVRALVLEWHDHSGPGEDPRGAALRALAAAGFETLPDPPSAYPHGVVWAWRQPQETHAPRTEPAVPG